MGIRDFEALSLAFSPSLVRPRTGREERGLPQPQTHLLFLTLQKTQGHLTGPLTPDS